MCWICEPSLLSTSDMPLDMLGLLTTDFPGHVLSQTATVSIIFIVSYVGEIDTVVKRHHSQ